MNRRLPALAILLGILGLIVFIVCGLGAITVRWQASAPQLLAALTSFGAVILGFLGGVHWGFALGDEAGRGERPRLVLGVVPALIGWVAVLVALVAPVEVTLAVLIVGFIAAALLDTSLRRQGFVPSGYLALRWGLTIAVVALLATVLVLRLIGAHIVL
jgi:hypothetical protein